MIERKKPLPRNRTPIAKASAKNLEACLRRGSTIAKRGGKPKPVNRQRRQSEFARCYHSKERVTWVKSRPCIIANGLCDGPIENAHVVKDGSEGMGRKGGYQCIAPLCRKAHRTLHSIGAEAFEHRFGVSLAFAAAQTELAWQSNHQAEFSGVRG